MLIMFQKNNRRISIQLLNIIKRLFLFLSALLLSSCQPLSLSADAMPWVKEAQVLFIDDFSSETGGWKTQNDRITFAGFANGRFRLWVDLPYYLVWTTPNLNFQDVNIYSKTEKISGPNDNLYGLMCRVQDSDNFYSFLISADGYYGIYKKESGIMRLVELDQMGYSEAIHQGEADNEILAVCQGDQLALFVNDVKLIQVTDSTFSSGDVGMITGNLSEPGTEILFNYFIVMKP